MGFLVCLGFGWLVCLFSLTIEMDKHICNFGMFGAQIATFMTKNVSFYTWNFGIWNMRLDVVKVNVYLMVYLFA